MASTTNLVASDLAVEGKDGGILHVDIHTGRQMLSRVFNENVNYVINATLRAEDSTCSSVTSMQHKMSNEARSCISG